jgi:hypothetical protein
MIGQILFGFKGLAAVFTGESRRRGMGLEMTTQKPLNKKALAAVQTYIIMCSGFLMML